jgi:hypothetical protein
MNRPIKSTLSVVGVLSIWAAAAAASVSVKINGSYFMPQDKNFADIYGGGIAYRLELSTPVLKHLEIWIEGGFFERSGLLTYTKEETRLSIVPAGGGLRFVSNSGRWNFSAGLAIDYFMFREANILGTLYAGQFGFAGTVGTAYFLERHLLAILELRYSYCRMKPEDLSFNLGGIEAGIGLGYRF